METGEQLLMIRTNSFALASDEYAAARPLYPAALYDWIVSNCEGREAAWDCATGNGQAAIGLAPFFGTVHATDISPEQIGQGFDGSNIVYSAQPAEATNFPAATFDLVTVAQALHWFDYDRFWPEVARVAKPGAFFCAWGYSWFTVVAEPRIQSVLVEPFQDLVAPFWAANNKILWDDYRDADISFPFERVPAPEFAVSVDWSVPQLIEYMKSWSAYKRAQSDPAVAEELQKLLREALKALPTGTRFHFTLPLVVAAGSIR